MKPSGELAFGAATAGDPYVPGTGNGGYRVTRYELELAYRLSSNRLAGRALVAVVTTEQLARLSFDFVGLSAAKVTVNGRRPKRFATQGRKLHIWFGRPVARDTALTIDVQYSGNPRPNRGHWGDVGWEELDDGVIVASQPDGAASWFPCNDHPSSKATYHIAITTDSPYRVVANGALVARAVGGSQTRWEFEQPEPMASYLATVQIGQYDLVELATRPVRQAVAIPARRRGSAESAFGRQSDMVAAFEQMFGPYPFGQYTVVVTEDVLEIPVEAQGLSIFGSNHLDGAHERLVAHELAHQWFGNSLTVRRWRDIWLHEGFACYAEWLWSERSGGPSAAKLADRHWDRLDEAPQDLVIADPGPDLMFDDRLYKRGALTLHALRLTVGDAGFFELLRAWTAAHRHGSVDTAQFVAHASAQAGRPLDGFFSEWLDHPRLPRLRAARGSR